MRSEAGLHGTEVGYVNLNELIEERIAALSGIAYRRRVELELEAPEVSPPIRGRREGFISLVDNLLENATKYSPPGGKVLVRISAADSLVELTVSDSGPGISPGLRDRVFERFYRAPDQAVTGSGLGLAIVRSVAESANAQVELEDADGGGLCIRIRFPSVK